MKASNFRSSALRTLAAPGLLAVFCFAPASSAAVTSVSTVYSGSDCRAGSYGVQGFTETLNGHIQATTGEAFTPLCPVPRLQPSFNTVYVEVYFMDTVDPSEENPATRVGCQLHTRLQTSAPASSDTSQPGASASMTGVYRGSSLFLQYKETASTSEPFFSAWTSSGAPGWRRTDLACDNIGSNTAIRSYVVTETST
jgi:hypothetical protein